MHNHSHLGRIFNSLEAINRVRTGHGKPRKSWNFTISFCRPGKSWNLSIGHGKSWKITKNVFQRTKQKIP